MNRKASLYILIAVLLLMPVVLSVVNAKDQPQTIFDTLCPDAEQMTVEPSEKDMKTTLQEYNDMIQMFIDELPTEARIDVNMIGETIHKHCVAVVKLPEKERETYTPYIEKMNALFEELLKRQNEFSHPEETPYARPQPSLKE